MNPADWPFPQKQQCEHGAWPWEFCSQCFLAVVGPIEPTIFNGPREGDVITIEGSYIPNPAGINEREREIAELRRMWAL